MTLSGRLNGAFVRLYNTDFVRSLIRSTGADVTIKRGYWAATSALLPDREERFNGTVVKLENPAGPDIEEHDVLEDLLNQLRPDDVFYDVGASKGLYSIFAGKVIDDGQIVAFEPHPARRDVLRRNLKRNNVTATVRTQALSDKVSTVNFGHRIGDNEFQITAVPGDDLITGDNLPEPTVTKFDIEGGELRAIRGLRSALRRDESRLVYVELHEYKMHDGFDQQVIDEFEQMDYDVEVISKRKVNGSVQRFIRGTR